MDISWPPFWRRVSNLQTVPVNFQVPNPTCVGSACGFNLTYGGSSIAADLTQDTLTLATDPVPAYTFGCIKKATGSSVPPQGLLGLGRGPLSLLSQTHSLYQSTFSYCLPSFKALNFSGSLRLGPIGQPKRIKYTPLLKNPRRSSLYYVILRGIKVGRRTVDIPPSALAFNPTTGAGTVIDSGKRLSSFLSFLIFLKKNLFLLGTFFGKSSLLVNSVLDLIKTQIKYLKNINNILTVKNKKLLIVNFWEIVGNKSIWKA